MDTRGHIETELIDDDVVYATGVDVFTHIRNKRFADLPDTPADIGKNNPGGLTKEQVVGIIERFSERADITTKRAWRTRRVNDYEVPVKFSHDQKRGRHRRRKRRSGLRGSPRVQTHAGMRGFADLPHVQVEDIEKVEVLNPRSVNDITDEEGRDEGLYIVDDRKGVIRPNTSLFVPTGRSAGVNSMDIEDARIRVTYTYGKSGSTTDEALPNTKELSTAVPPDIRDAVALLTAARLIGSDQYGELTPAQGGDSPSLSEAVSSWRSEAEDVLREYTRP